MKRKEKTKYVVVGCKPWSKSVFDNKISKYPGEWFFIKRQKNLTEKKLKEISPKYVFFLHWSWKVPEKIIKNYKCICFHMTDVPYGRGGTPLQNLIIRGHEKTKLTALKMVKDFDAGPVYLKKPMSLAGRAQDVYYRASQLAAQMISKIIKEELIPKPQKGKVVIFKRREPKESEIPRFKKIRELYNFIRMLDTEDYPRAFLRYKGFVLEFFCPKLTKNQIYSKVKIKKYSKYEK